MPPRHRQETLLVLGSLAIIQRFIFLFKALRLNFQRLVLRRLYWQPSQPTGIQYFVCYVCSPRYCFKIFQLKARMKKTKETPAMWTTRQTAKTVKAASTGTRASPEQKTDHVPLTLLCRRAI